MTHTAFDVYRYGAWIERVYFPSASASADSVRESLIKEGYPSDITVHLAAKRTA